MRHEGPDTPIGIALWETTQRVMRAFDKTLAEFGGNRPVWFVFLALDEADRPTQRELARAVGIREATLSHHISALEARGLVIRERDDNDRRVQRIAFTPAGRESFERMLEAAVTYERRLRDALGATRVARLRESLRMLSDAVRDPADGEVLPPVE